MAKIGGKKKKSLKENQHTWKYKEGFLRIKAINKYQEVDTPVTEILDLDPHTWLSSAFTPPSVGKGGKRGSPPLLVLPLLLLHRVKGSEY